MTAPALSTPAPAVGKGETAAPADGSRALRVMIINGSPNERSKTVGLADVILDTLGRRLPVEGARVDVYRLGSGFTEATERDEVSAEVEAVLQQVENADVLLAAAPVFRGSYPGMFKHFFDLVEQYALANKPVLLAATGGTERHALVLEHALRPLFAFFQALTVPVSFFASAADFDGTTLLNPRVYGRIEVGIADVVPLLQAIASNAGPMITSRTSEHTSAQGPSDQSCEAHQWDDRGLS